MKNNYSKTRALRKRQRELQVRRQIIALISCFCIALFIILFVGNICAKADNQTKSATVKQFKNIEVEPGDTLTSLAVPYVDGTHYSNVSEYIEEVLYMNHLDQADSITAGDYLILPYYTEVSAS